MTTNTTSEDIELPVLGLDVKGEIEILEGVELFSIKCIRNMTEIKELHSGAISIDSKWRLFKVQTDPHDPPIPVYDDSDYLRKGKKVYALSPIKDKNWITKWLDSIPDDIKDKLEYIVSRHGLDENDLVESLSQILMRPIPRLKNPYDIPKFTKERKRSKKLNKFLSGISSLADFGNI